ncbi:hypothetical protein ACMGD3_10955 [Lysinibacillus sphaericus]
MEERKQMIQEVNEHLKQLEQSTELTFGDDTEEQGWHVVKQYIAKHR